MKKSVLFFIGLLLLLSGCHWAGAQTVTPLRSLLAPLPLIAYPVRTTLMNIENDVPNGTVTIALPPPTADAFLGWDYTTDPVHPVPVYYAMGNCFTRTAATNNASGTINISSACAGTQGPAGPQGPQGPAGTNATQVNSDWAASSGVAAILNKPTIPAAQVQSDWQAVSGLGVILNKPTIPAAQVNSDWSASSGVTAILNKPTIPAAQVQSDWNASSGLGVILNKPTIPTATPFNFGVPTTRTIAVSTVYQATDTTKADILTLSPSCQNVTSVVASSACTLQVRQASAAGLTCSTGTVTQTWTSLVNLGLVFTQTSGSPLDVKLPIGGYFILCPTAGTFTISAVEQSAG